MTTTHHAPLGATTDREVTMHTDTTCTDCGGYLARAFASSSDYLRCKRCGHVFPIASTEGDK